MTTNPIGVHALVWSGGWDEADARRAIEGAAATGYDLVELLLMDPDSIDVPMTRRLLADSGMRVTASLGLSADTDVSSEDEQTVDRGRNLLRRAVEVAADLGAEYVGGVVYGALRKYSAPVTAAGRRHAVAAVAEMGSLAAREGIPVGLEIVNRYESNLLNTAEQAVAFIEETGSDNVYVHLDSYHMNIEEHDLGLAVRRCGDRLGYVHIGESHRGYLGSGTVDFTSLFRALVETGYSGPITFESFSSTVVDPDLSFTLAIWRDLWDDSRALAEHARAFIDVALRAR
jgi:D-psicose/D-tagatose/L-ribulose 3-epimerase